MSEPDRAVVGEILGAYGVAGAVRVRPLSDAPGRAASLDDILLLRDGEEKAARVVEVRPVERGWIVRLDGCVTREEAETLRGCRLAVPAATRPPLPSGTFYVSDLVGRTVVTEDGGTLGTLKDVLATGSNDVYVIEGAAGELLFPALKQLVLDVGPDRGPVRVRLLPGLLEACTTRGAP